MVRGTNIYKGGIVFLPISTVYPKWKFIINGVNVTSFVTSAEVTRVATDRLSYARITFDNDKGRFNNKWEGGEIIKIYFDYATSSTFTTHVPTNQIYNGKLDSAKPGLTTNGYTMEVASRERPELVDNVLTLEFDSESITNALKTVIEATNTKLGYTVINYDNFSIESTNKTTSANYRGQKIMNILTDLCKRANFDSRIDVNGKFNAFTVGSKICYKEAIVSGANLLMCPPSGRNTTLIKNNIMVYGPEKEGCLICWTEKASTYKPWRKDLIINDTSNQTLAQCQDRAKKEYNNLFDAEIVANPVCIGMPYLREGDYVKTFVQYCDLDGYYVAKQVSHILNMSGAETRVTLGEQERGGLELIKNNERDIREKSTFNNPNDMEYSYHFIFDNETNIDTHANTLISNGKLELVSGQDTGTMTSKALNADYEAHYAEIRFVGNDDCDISTFGLSFNDGGDYTSIKAGKKGEPGEKLSIAKSGNKIRLRINMKSSTAKPKPEIESCVLLFK